jgi:uncharacterized protein (TIGR02466 family)
MSDVYLSFPTPILRVPATENNYTPVQLEIKNAYESIHLVSDTTSVSYNYKAKGQTSMSEKTYDFIQRYNCVELEKRIYSAVDEYLDRTGWGGEKTFSIKNSWININDEGTDHNAHCHPGYDISGVYYFRVSEAQGGLSFNNPNTISFHGQFPQGPMCPQTLTIVPDDGDIILFPSWMIHGVRKNRSTEQRISIAFNLDYTGSNDIAFGLAKQSHVPYHRVEQSLKGIIK